MTASQRVRESCRSEIERVGLFGSAQKQKALKTLPAKPKYRKGELTWSGFGSQPAWVKQHLALGGTLDELL